MRIFRNSFDINEAIFDCGSCLTYFRTNFDKKKHNTLKLESDSLDQVNYFFPRLKKTLSSHLTKSSKMTLIFWHRDFKEENHLQDEVISGPCKVFVINAKKSAPFEPGVMINLDAGEDIFLSYKDFAYGFVLVLRENS